MKRKKPKSKTVDWANVKVPKPIDVPEEVMMWEQAYNLPRLDAATVRQRDYARITRHAVMAPVLSGMMDAAAALPDPSHVYAVVDHMRSETRAGVWINTHYPHRRDPINYVLYLASNRQRNLGEVR